MALEVELETYRKRLPEFKTEHKDQWVLIHGEDVVGFFESYEEALGLGYEKFGLDDFLLREVQEVEPVYYMTSLSKGVGIS
jgi:hypothetical protein